MGFPSLYSCPWLPQCRYSVWMETPCVSLCPSAQVISPGTAKNNLTLSMLLLHQLFAHTVESPWGTLSRLVSPSSLSTHGPNTVWQMLQAPNLPSTMYCGIFPTHNVWSLLFRSVFWGSHWGAFTINNPLFVCPSVLFLLVSGPLWPWSILSPEVTEEVTCPPHAEPLPVLFFHVTVPQLTAFYRNDKIFPPPLKLPFIKPVSYLLSIVLPIFFQATSQGNQSSYGNCSTILIPFLILFVLVLCCFAGWGQEIWLMLCTRCRCPRHLCNGTKWFSVLLCS